MSIDDSALRDPRVKRLARMLHKRFGDNVTDWPDFARRYALGTLLEVWALPYDRVNPVVPSADIDETALIDNFSDAMIVAGLAEAKPDGAWVKGAKKRILYLEKKEIADAVRQAREDTAPSIEADKPKKLKDPKEPKPPKEEKVPGYTATVTHFQQRYTARFEAKPTWNGKTGKLLVALVKMHGAAEVERRIDVLFDSPPSFLSASPPDVGTLSQHFDKLVAPAGRPTMPRGTGRFEPKDGTDYDKPPWEHG